jgi:hypothetical protein
VVLVPPPGDARAHVTGIAVPPVPPWVGSRKRAVLLISSSHLSAGTLTGSDPFSTTS